MHILGGESRLFTLFNRVDTPPFLRSSSLLLDFFVRPRQKCLVQRNTRR